MEIILTYRWATVENRVTQTAVTPILTYSVTNVNQKYADFALFFAIIEKILVFFG